MNVNVSYWRALACFSLLMPVACIAQDEQTAPLAEPAILNMNFCQPAYPRESVLRGEHGVVKLQFTIGVTGRLVGSRIVKSSGFRTLDTAALTALIHCHFRPAYRNEVPVQASFMMDYEWSLTP